MTTISTVGSLVNASVTSSQSTGTITTVNVGDLVVANIVVFANISITGISSSNVTWFSEQLTGYNSTLGLNAFQFIGTVSATGSGTTNLTFSSSIGTTKVQFTIQQYTSGLGSAGQWFLYYSEQTNAASTTLTYPTGTAATPANVGYYPYAPNGGQATQTGLPFAYIGYGIGGSTGSAGSTSGFGYTVDANSGVLAVNTGVTQGSTPAPTAHLASSTQSVSMGLIVMPVLSGAAFLTQAASGLRVALEIAWGANLADLTGNSWVWTDVTGDVLMDPAKTGDAIKVRLGSPTDTPGQQTQPSEMTATLLNSAGQYSQGGQSPNYPNVQRNTPVRLRVLSGGVWYVKYQAGVVSLQPKWDVTGRWATVVLTAAGPLRRLNQGSLPVQSVLRAEFPLQPNLAAYWPMEDGKSSSTFASAVSGIGPLQTANQLVGWQNINYQQTLPLFASDSSFRIPTALPQFSNQSAGGTLLGSFCDYPGWPSALANQVSLFLLFKETPLGSATSPENGGVFTFISLPATAPNASTLYQINVSAINGGGVAVRGMTGGYFGTLTYDTGVLLAAGDLENPSALCVTLAKSGSDINWSLVHMALMTGTVKSYSGTWTGAATHFWPPLNMQILPNVLTQKFVAGHILLLNQSSNVLSGSSFQNIVLGHPGESVTARLTRLANNANIPIAIVDSAVGETSSNPADTMGPQVPDTLSNLLRECEATGQGVLLDGLGAGLTYLTRKLVESQQPIVTLDANVGNLAFAFEPVDDDQNIVNDVTVTRRNGGTATYQQLTGADGINVVGDYPSSITVNQNVDDYLSYTAQWMANLGTPGGYRYPKLEFALEFNPALISAWLSMVPFGRLDVTNIVDIRTQMQNATIKNLVTGWTETIDLFRWHVEANCTSYDPWRVITLAAAAGSTSDTTCWLDTDGSQLHASAAQGATSIQVDVTAGPRWVTTADTGGSDNFPFYINLGGVQVQVTNVTGTSNPQTFTVSALPQAFASGTAVSIWDPPVLGM